MKKTVFKILCCVKTERKLLHFPSYFVFDWAFIYDERLYMTPSDYGECVHIFYNNSHIVSMAHPYMWWFLEVVKEELNFCNVLCATVFFFRLQFVILNAWPVLFENIVDCADNLGKWNNMNNTMCHMSLLPFCLEK